MTLTSASPTALSQERRPSLTPRFLLERLGLDDEIALDVPASATAVECTSFHWLIKERNYSAVT